MKQIVVLSGKGGTGKTTIAAALIKITNNLAFADCDVDAPNLNIIYNNADELTQKDFYGDKKAIKIEEVCIECGKCETLCRFDAIKNNNISIMDCEGCGVCEYFCPVGAIKMVDNISGKTYVSKINNKIFSYAELLIGNGASGKLVTEVRKNIYDLVDKEELVIIDGSPGIGCPVIASITGTDYVLVVAEPSLSGLHDLKRIIDTARRFGAKCIVCINKYDINQDITSKIEKYCYDEKISLIGKIPYDKLVIEALNNKKSIIEYPESIASKAIFNISNNLNKIISNKEELN